MENENLAFWNKYKVVPSNAMKPFDNGKFKGTDINTMWRMKCLTEYYGPCGIGWYFVPKKLWSETYSNGDVFAFAEIELFVKNKETSDWSMPISGNGGNKIVRTVVDKYSKETRLSTSDEGYKMAVTDAFGVACKALGIGADVYWENDRTKYTSEAEERLATPEQIARIRELKCIEKGICDRFHVDKIEQLLYSDAETVIRMKEQALAK